MHWLYSCSYIISSLSYHYWKKFQNMCLALRETPLKKILFLTKAWFWNFHRLRKTLIYSMNITYQKNFGFYRISNRFWGNKKEACCKQNLMEDVLKGNFITHSWKLHLCKTLIFHFSFFYEVLVIFQVLFIFISLWMFSLKHSKVRRY